MSPKIMTKYFFGQVCFKALRCDFNLALSCKKCFGLSPEQNFEDKSKQAKRVVTHSFVQQKSCLDWRCHINSRLTQSGWGHCCER